MPSDDVLREFLRAPFACSNCGEDSAIVARMTAEHDALNGTARQEGGDE